jgi:hypothetical protein
MFGLIGTDKTQLVTEISPAIVLPAFQRTHVGSHAVGLLLKYALDVAPSGVGFLAGSNGVQRQSTYPLIISPNGRGLNSREFQGGNMSCRGSKDTKNGARRQGRVMQEMDCQGEIVMSGRCAGTTGKKVVGNL